MSAKHCVTNVLRRGNEERIDIVRVSVCCLNFMAGIAFLTFSSLVSASADAVSAHEVVTAKSLAKTLKNKPDTKCDEPDASQIEALNLNRGCLVPLSSIDKLRGQKDFSFVDVRSPAAYDHYHITGSINIPLHQVRTKEFLKKLSVVMVNDGRSTGDLEKTCIELKQAGFNRVSVLEGGLYAWRANKRTLEGDPIAQTKLNRMSADELIEERTKPNLYVIDISTQGKHKDLNAWLPAKIISVPMKSTSDSIARVASIVLKQRKINPRSRPLLIADDNTTYELIDAKSKKSSVTNDILRLDGGINGYREIVKRQLALWSEQNKPRRYDACKG